VRYALRIQSGTRIRLVWYRLSLLDRRSVPDTAMTRTMITRSAVHRALLVVFRAPAPISSFIAWELQLAVFVESTKSCPEETNSVDRSPIKDPSCSDACFTIALSNMRRTKLLVWQPANWIASKPEQGPDSADLRQGGARSLSLSCICSCYLPSLDVRHPRHGGFALEWEGTALGAFSRIRSSEERLKSRSNDGSGCFVRVIYVPYKPRGNEAFRGRYSGTRHWSERSSAVLTSSDGVIIPFETVTLSRGAGRATNFLRYADDLKLMQEAVELAF
jgi:hypothetical protein